MKYKESYIVIAMYVILLLWVSHALIETGGVYFGLKGTDSVSVGSLIGVLAHGLVGTVMGIIIVSVTFTLALVLALVSRFVFFKHDDMQDEAVKIAKLLIIACINLAIICIVVNLFKMFFSTLICFALIAGLFYVIVCPKKKIR